MQQLEGFLVSPYNIWWLWHNSFNDSNISSITFLTDMNCKPHIIFRVSEIGTAMFLILQIKLYPGTNILYGLFFYA